MQLSAQGVRVEVRWIKAHTGFKGNEVAEGVAKWASFAILPTSLILLPPQKGSITWQGMPVLGKLTQNHTATSFPSPCTQTSSCLRATTGFGPLLGSGVYHSNGLRVFSALRDTTHISEWRNTPVQPANTLTPWSPYQSQLFAIRQLTSSRFSFRHGQHHCRP